MKSFDPQHGVSLAVLKKSPTQGRAKLLRVLTHKAPLREEKRGMENHPFINLAKGALLAHGVNPK
jgi:hypothetical protein